MAAPTAPRPRGAVVALKWSLLALGGLLFALLIRHYGTRETLGRLLAVWPALPLMMMIESAAKTANALGLRRALSREGRRTPFLEIFRLILEADAVNYLLPTASLGGNAILVRGLMRRGTLSESVVAVASANSAQVTAQFLLVLAGSALALAATPIPASLRPAIWAVMGLSLVIVCVFLLVQVNGVFVLLSSVLRRVHIRIPYLLERERQIAALDSSLRGVLRNRPADLALSTFFFACGWAVSAAEIYAVLRLMKAEFGWQQVLAIHALAVFIDGVVFFVPARAGSQEGGKILAFTAVGLQGGAGLTFGLLRRTREIIWALFGYALLAQRAGGGVPAVVPAPVL
ncbi:MAG: lysylphosphatidylglycerol synthase domain-containing protein [Elusimicrobiota bacterium]